MIWTRVRFPPPPLNFIQVIMSVNTRLVDLKVSVFVLGIKTKTSYIIEEQQHEKNHTYLYLVPIKDDFIPINARISDDNFELFVRKEKVKGLSGVYSYQLL